MAVHELKVGIIGHGAIGSALGRTFTTVGGQVEYWDRDPAKATVASEQALAEQSRVIIIAAPSWVNREILQKLKPALSGKLVITLAKGVEDGFVLMSQVLSEEAGGSYDYGLLYGPMLAAELQQGLPTAAVLAVSDQRWFGSFDILRPHLRCDYSLDLTSVALSGALKNVYALAFGINDGIGAGLNAKGALAVRVLAEIKAILKHRQADVCLAEGLTGLGDLLATGWSESSFNHRIGKTLAQGGKPEDINGEGVHSLRELCKVVPAENFAVLNALRQVVLEGADPKTIEVF